MFVLVLKVLKIIICLAKDSILLEESGNLGVDIEIKYPPISELAREFIVNQ
jgi:hypothetical protein